MKSDRTHTMHTKAGMSDRHWLVKSDTKHTTHTTTHVGWELYSHTFEILCVLCAFWAVGSEKKLPQPMYVMCVVFWAVRSEKKPHQSMCCVRFELFNARKSSLSLFACSTFRVQVEPRFPHWASREKAQGFRFLCCVALCVLSSSRACVCVLLNNLRRSSILGKQSIQVVVSNRAQNVKTWLMSSFSDHEIEYSAFESRD